MNKRISSNSLLKGQAIIELCVCLVAVIALLTAMLQLASITKAQTDTMINARAQAAALSMAEAAILPANDYIYDWSEGTDDGVRYTADDEIITVRDASSFFNNIVEKSVSDAGEWNTFSDHGNYIYNLHDAYINSPFANPALYFGMVKGESSQSVSLIPAFRKLIYNKSELTIKSTAWSTWTKGIY